MTAALGNLPADTLEALMQAAQSEAPADRPDAVDYDWHRPCRYGWAERQRLEQFATQASTAVADAIERLLLQRPQFQARPVQQAYRPQAQETLAADGYVVALAAADRSAGALLVPTVSALQWVERLLGGAGEADEPRELTNMEREILRDVAGAVVAAVSEVSVAFGGPELQPAGVHRAGQWELHEDGSGQYCCLTLTEQSGEEVTLLIDSEQLDPVAGREPVADDGQAVDRMRGHLGETALRAEVSLGQVEVTTREVLSLQAGDVLLLGRSAADPVLLRVQGEPVASGWPCQSAGSYGLQVCDRIRAAADSSSPGESPPPAGPAEGAADAPSPEAEQ
ncbi:MAG: FliM/FliN family flagellar motor switch protein [Planctomycetota bacterium]